MPKVPRKLPNIKRFTMPQIVPQEIPKTFEDAKNDLVNINGYPRENFFNDLYTRGLDQPGDEQLIKDLNYVFNKLQADKPAESLARGIQNSIVQSKESRRLLLDYCCAAIKNDMGKIKVEDYDKVETIYNEANRLSGSVMYSFTQAQQNELDKYKTQNITLRDGEEAQDYIKRVFDELTELKEQKNTGEIVTRLIGIQTYLEQSNNDYHSLDGVDDAAYRVVSRFLMRSCAKSQQSFNLTVDPSESEFLYQLANEMGKASADLRIQNGKDKREMEKLIEDGAIPDTESIIDKDEAKKAVAGALVDTHYYNAQRLNSLNILFERVENLVQGIKVSQDLRVEGKDISLSSSLKETFDKGARDRLEELQNPLKGEAKEEEKEFFNKGAFADPKEASERYGYGINPLSQFGNQSLFFYVPDGQREISKKTKEEFHEKTVQSSAKLTLIQNYSFDVKAISSTAEAKLHALDSIKKAGHGNSREFTHMRDALVAVTRLGDNSTPAEVERALDSLKNASSEYFRTRNVWYRSNRQFGQERLASSAEIRDWSGTQLTAILEKNSTLKNNGVISEEKSQKISDLRSSMISSVHANETIAAKKALKLEDLAEKNEKTKKEIDYHKVRIDIHAKANTKVNAKAKDDPALNGPVH